jgi:uncharacterized membrane protein
MHNRVRSSTEGRLLFLGVVLLMSLLVALVFVWATSHTEVHIYAAMTGLNLIIGRAAGMSFGYASGLGHSQVIPLNMLVESIHVLIVFPLFVLSWRKLVRMRILTRYFEHIHHSASTHSDVVRRFGIAGLFFFVFVPFWMTGPVVGSIIGFLIGLRPWTNVMVVLISTYIAICIWALLLNELSAWAETANRTALFALILAVVLITVAIHLLYRHRTRRKFRNQ